MLKREIFAEAMIQWSGPDLVGITRQRQLQLGGNPVCSAVCLIRQ